MSQGGGQAIRKIYKEASDKDRNLRNCVLNICVTNANTLFRCTSGLPVGSIMESEFWRVIHKLTTFPAELCIRMVASQNPPGYKTYSCFQ